MKTALSPNGMKRICTSCGVRFYDMNKRPIVCPGCSTEFTGDIKLKSRRGRLPAEEKKTEQKPAAVAANDEEEIFNEDIVSLEDVEEDSDDTDDDAIDLGEEDLDDLPEIDEDEDSDLDEDVADAEEED